MSYFTELGLAEPILRALGTKGYSDPTPIQRQAIPALLQGRDLLGIAQTGTGKTAAFSLPSIHRLAANPQPRKAASCRMLVLSPTRELAAQIAENMRGYAKYVNLSVQCIFGGVPVGKQARALVPGCDILVATPGRLLDLIDQRALTLRNVEIFVLDEADQMMDLGFIVPLKRVAKLLPADRQSLFFSATMPQSIAELGKQFINDPVRVEVAPQSTTAERVEQYATMVNQSEKQALLTLRLRGGFADGSIDRALVFTRTKHGADRVVKHLMTANIPSAAIHGNKSQGQRTAAIKGFRTGEVPVLVATDIAARGIDIPGVSHVFNFELPNVPEQYVHRIGRTARAGADGISMSFVAPDEKAYLRDIEKLTRVKLDVMPLPEDFAKEASRLPLPSRKSLPVDLPERGDRQPRGGRRGPPARGGQAPARGERGGHAGRGHDRGGRDRIEEAGGWTPPVGPSERDDAPRHARGERPARPGGPRQEHRAGESVRHDRAGRPARAEGAHRHERNGEDGPRHRRPERPEQPRQAHGERPERRGEHGRPQGERAERGDFQRRDRSERPARQDGRRDDAPRHGRTDRHEPRGDGQHRHGQGRPAHGHGDRNETRGGDRPMQRRDGQQDRRGGEGHRGPRGDQVAGQGAGRPAGNRNFRPGHGSRRPG